MSNDNYAADIDAAEDDEYDVEAGMGSSRCHLMQTFEEERPTTLVGSIKESAKSSKRKIMFYSSFILIPIKKILTTFRLLILIAIYSFAGAHLFMYFEASTDLAAKEDDFHQRKIAREVMVLNLRAIYYDNLDDREERWKHAILKFEADMGLDEPVVETAWTFWMSFLYAGTIFTTIGYGNIACKTKGGQIATMIYAFVGIPLMLVMLSSLNQFLLKWIDFIAIGYSDMKLYLGVRFGLIAIDQDDDDRKRRYNKMAQLMKDWRLAREGATMALAVSTLEEQPLTITGDSERNEEDEERKPDPPVVFVLIATVAWILLSAAVFCLFEDWTFFTSFYFCFISLTTIGLGDVTPANPEYMIATFGVVLVGLSMLTVCIDVINEKIALLYMKLLNEVTEDYMKAVTSGDPNAATDMMAKFKGKSKFLKHMIGKSGGNKVMDKFKQDCAKKGIEPPPVLTNINPETGMPAFVNAKKEEFRDHIQVAEERAAEEQQRIAQTPLSKSTDFLLPPSRKSSFSPPQKVSLEVQAGTTMGKFHDYGAQTYQESSDEGIQTDFEFEDTKIKEEPIMTDAETQYEIVLLTSIGIQPEVSSIYIGADLEEYSSGSDEESGLESEHEQTYKETSLPFEVADPGILALGLQSPPIEITPFTDDESATSEARSSPAKLERVATKLTPAKVEKSASMDSTDTVIHVKPEEKEEKEQKEHESDTGEGKKRKKKLKSKKLREQGLRFLKNSGNQTSPTLADSSTQYEIFTTESGSQYDVKGRSRKCQTKLSSINHEQLQGIRETVQKLKRRESEMSRVTNVSESDWELSSKASESGKDPEVAEVSLDLSVIALGVDETGKVVEFPKVFDPMESVKSSLSPESPEDLRDRTTSVSIMSTSTSVDPERMNWEDDEEIESLEELELFSTDTSAQTDEKVMVDRQDLTTPRMLDAIKNCSTQTTFSTFHLPQKVYESASTSSDEEQDGEHGGEGRKAEKEKSEVYFMTNTGVQTIQTSFHATEETPKPAEQEKEQVNTDVRLGEEQLQTEPSETSEELVLFLKNSDSQTEELEMTSCSTSTEEVKIVEEKETSEGECQTSEVVTFNCEAQTILQDYSDSNMQTEETVVGEIGSQTEVREDVEVKTQTEDVHSSEVDVQTEAVEAMPVECQTDGAIEVDVVKPDTASLECQTEILSSAEVEIQANIIVETGTADCQTETLQLEELEVQTELEQSVSESQTDRLDVNSVEMQTEMEDTSTSESQTETISVDEVEIQTDLTETMAGEMQTDQPIIEVQFTQTDEVSFVGEVPVVDNVAQSDTVELADSETQYTTTSLEDVDVQATPISYDTQTQHSIEIDAKSCQTELVATKNKRSQNDDSLLLKVDNESQVEVDTSSINLSPIRTEVTHSFTMTEPGESEEKEVQVDEDCFEDTAPKYYSGPLWSDFDYTPVLEDEEVVDGETQTEDGSDGGGSEDVSSPTEEILEEDRENVEDGEDSGELGESGDNQERNTTSTVSTTEPASLKKAKKLKSKTSKSTKTSEGTTSTSEGGTKVSTKTSSKASAKKSTKSTKSSSSTSPSEPPQSGPSDDSEFAIQCAPESSDVQMQTVKFKKRKEEKNVEARVEMSTSTVQATTEMCEQSAGGVGEDDWLQVYVQELDEERRLRMSDIGIQTGVLARVQHIYTRPISDGVEATSSAPITLRKSSDSSEHISAKTAKSSEESLVPSASGTGLSASESMDDHLWAERASPFASRHSSMKRGKSSKEEEKKGDKTNIVQDLRARFEMKSPSPKSPKDGDGQGSSKHFNF